MHASTPLGLLELIMFFGVVGGLVGYFTNVVAIRLLFRPLEKKCLLPGSRLCIQGLIPSRRRQLAERLGSVIASYAYSGSIRERYRARLEESVTRAIRDAILERIAQNPLGAMLAPIVSQGLEDLVSRTLTPLLMRLIEDASSRVDVEAVVREELEAMPLEELERVFWGIAGRELRFIEVMGFVLGFLIGLVEALVFLLAT